jgi:hypothetical protein
MKTFFKKNPGVTIPAPLPGYALAALIPLALLPFTAAAVIWTMLLLLAWYACIATLSRFAGIGWDVALAIFALSLGMLSLPFGEVVPLSLAGICIAAYCAWSGRATAAAIAAAASMIEPHLGLPVCVALAWWRPATRVPLAVAFVALASLSIATLGVATNVEYFASVLPMHALSEATRDTQYSLTAILAAVGVPQIEAVRAGTLWYLAMLVAGVLTSGALARRFGNDAFLCCIPPAFAVFGGTFIHLTQIAAALPAAALLVTYSKRPYHVFALVALIALAVPWGWSVSPALLMAPVFPIGYIVWRMSGGKTVPALLCALAGAVAIFGFQELYTIHAPHLIAHQSAPNISGTFPEASWSGYSRGNSNGSLASWAVRIPTWTALALLLWLLVREVWPSRFNVRRAAPIALALVCTLLPIGAQFYGDRAGGWLGVDIRAYYCAALAERTGEDPYLTQSVSQCEHETPAPYYRPPARVAVPAPYPPYVLALFTPLTLLPFSAAAIIWWFMLLAGLIAGAYALARVAHQPFLVGWAVVALSAGLMSLPPGNMMPFALGALLLGALAVSRRAYRWAAVAICVAMAEPHVALPAALALFIGVRAMRVPLLIGAAALGSLSLFAGGFGRNAEYLTAVLPAHALSEVSRDNQFSLSTVLAAFGLSDRSAAIIGTLSYLAMTAFGIVIALRLTARYREAALVVLVPPAVSLLGGNFVHAAEIAAAAPAALLLYVRVHTYRAWIFAALLLLAVPWMTATSAAVFLAPLFPAAYLTHALWRRELTPALAVAVGSFALLLGLFMVANVHWTHSHLTRTYAPIDPSLAEASWRDFVLGNTTNNPAMWLLRTPTWIGLLALVGGAAALTRATRRHTPALDYRLSESRT